MTQSVQVNRLRARTAHELLTCQINNFSIIILKEGNVLFNDALNTFYIRLYGVRHMVKYHTDSERKPAAATWATLSD